VRAPVKLLFASSNAGKLREFQGVAREFTTPAETEVEPVPGYAELPSFDETAPTFAENALGKALHYSRLCGDAVFADDSGLVVPALGGAPGVHSARYAGLDATNDERIQQLLGEMRGKRAAERAAHFVCAIALASRGHALAVVTARADGEILEAPRGTAGFGYDPVFFFPPLGKTLAELSAEVKNQHSHRGKAFRKLLDFLSAKPQAA
jgi:XTP/dITP diphosphohydrolase